MRSRTPYEIQITGAGLELVVIDIYIYTGTKNTDKGSITYQLRALAVTLDSTSGNPEVIIDLAPFVRDFLRSNIEFNNDYNTYTYWVSYVTTRTVSGVEQTPDAIVHLNADFGYHTNDEGANFIGLDSGSYLDRFDRDVIIKPKEQGLTIAVNYDVNQVNFIKDGLTLYSLTLTGLSADESEDRIQYITEDFVSSESFKSEVLRDGGIYNGFEYLDRKQCLALRSYFPEYDKVVINRFDETVLNTDLEQNKVIRIENVDVNYSNYKVVFVNKKGAFEDLYFYGNDKEKIKTESTEIKRNVRSGGTYSTSKHQYRSLFKNGRKSLTLNSGFVPESLNNAFEEMLLSETVWLVYEGRTEPVTVTSSSLEFKKQNIEDLIAYTIEVSFAYDVLNNFQ